MKFSLLSFLCLAQLLTPITAFGLYGAYERVAYYYAWKIDKALNGGKATTIAKGTTGTTLYDFVNYIAGDRVTVTSFTTAVGADVDDLARQLNTLGINGNYASVRVVENVKTIDGLFKEVGNFIGSNLGDTQFDTMDPTLLRSFRAAVQRVQFLRTYARSETIFEKLTADGVTPSTKTKTLTLMSGARQTYEFLDISATTQNNPGAKVQSLIKGYDTEGGTESNHVSNIKTITWARSQAGGCSLIPGI